MSLDRKTYQSLGFWLGTVLLLGQLGARIAGISFGGPFDWIFLGGSFFLVLGPMFGEGFLIEVVRALRSEYGGPPDTPGTAKDQDGRA